MQRDKIIIVFSFIAALAMLATALYYHVDVASVTKAPQAQKAPVQTTQAMPSGAMDMSKLFGSEDVDPALSKRAGELMMKMQENPNDPQVTIDLSLLFLEAQDYVASLNFATRASTLDPSNATAAYLKAVAHSQLGEIESAIKEFNRSLSLNENPATHFGLAVLYKYNANDAAMAKSHLEKALQMPNLTEDMKGRITNELKGL